MSALDQVFIGAREIIPGQPVVPGFGFSVACRGAGNVCLVMADGSKLNQQATVGTGEFRGYAIKDVDPAKTNADVTVSVLY